MVCTILPFGGISFLIMITEKQFQDYIGQLSDSYEEIKNAVYLTTHRTTDAMDINEKLAKFRDIACTALREAYITKNFGDN